MIEKLPPKLKKSSNLITKNFHCIVESQLKVKLMNDGHNWIDERLKFSHSEA